MTSLKLGRFIQDEVGTLHGRVAGLGIGSISVLSEEAKTAEGKLYLKLIADPLNAAYEVGVAFPKEKDGMHYYSAVLDSPIFQAPLSVAFFPDKEKPHTFNVVWKRPDQYISNAEIDGKPQTGHSTRRYVGAQATVTP